MTTITRYLPFILMCAAFVAILLGIVWLSGHYAFM
jgi:hypothetical protein